MEMASKYLETIEGIAAYPLFSLIVFFLFFVVLIIWVVKADKGYLKKMEQLPLDPENNQQKNSTGDYNEDK
jgi:cytochrome c oxidase cbb3-type subunit IV